ncbi:MAG: hypothetical protein E7773_10150 [Sphingomonas sp.]|uniref:hypothetical protein n=1 Tax=Sphingomonas sp. TaxID=28214 RepID=UPI00120D42F0|nr:hypothetical protein [Sphingomonas sp.]THD35699.1 MAG: hypothetical protein E7773_10150 [Sphingomonas sp.]
MENISAPGTKHRTYTILKGMKQRCSDPNHRSYHRYGGRGIQVCDEWRKDFRAFQSWAINNGYADDLTIDRIDNDKGYSPENCQWVSQRAQSHNRHDNVLTMIDANAIRAAYAAGGVSMRKLGARYGVMVSTIHGIVHGTRWVE